MKKAKKLSLKQRAKKAGIPVQLVYNRKSAGWSEKKALSVPVGKYTPRKPKKDDQLWGTEARKKKVAYTVKDLKEADKKYKKAVSDFESIKPRKVAYKVEPKKEQASGSRVKPIPMEGIQKFEAPKRSNWQIYVVVALVGVLALAMILR